MQFRSSSHRAILTRVVPVVLIFGIGAFGQPQYSIHDLGQLSPQGSGVTGINIAGQVIGQTQVSGQAHAFRTAPNAAINLTTDDLGTLGGATSTAAAINASGQVVGTSLTGNGQTHGFRTAPNAAINPSTDDLGTLGGATSQAYWINSAGQVTGTSTAGTSTARQAFLTAPNAAINASTDNIGALTFAPVSANYSEGLGVNSQGHVSGDFLPSPSAAYPTAFFYNGATITELPFIMAPGSNFTPLNDQDQIAFTAANVLSLWQSGQPTVQLATCGTGCQFIPWMMNNSGQIVGDEDSPTGGSFLYSNGTVYLLSSLVPPSSGWVFQTSLLAINDVGQIAGVASLNGQPHAFRLDPVTTGSIPHLVEGAGWNETLTLINKSATSIIASMNFYAAVGSPLSLPLVFPQNPQSGSSANSASSAIPANGLFALEATGSDSGPLLEGSAQVSGNGPPLSMDGFAIFHYDPTNQEAVVPLETRNASSYLLAYDNTNSVVTGVAIATISSGGEAIPVVIRDDTGTQIATSSISFNANGHTSFVLSTQFPVTANRRGTIEFDTPTGAQISVLGIRYTPPGTLTTIPALANVTKVGGSVAHLAVNDTWQTTFVLVNTGAASASATLSFFDDSGNPLALSLTNPQGTVAPQTVSTVTQAIAANASLWLTSVAANQTASFVEGSAQLISTGNVSGYVILRYNANGQEAVVPLESRTASAYFIGFDNTSGTVTGLALANASAQAVNIPVTVRDDMGNVLGTNSISLNANGHASFLLGAEYPSTAGARGTVEFDKPSSGTISVLGIRAPPVLTFTTLPALAK